MVSFEPYAASDGPLFPRRGSAFTVAFSRHIQGSCLGPVRNFKRLPLLTDDEDASRLKPRRHCKPPLKEVP